MDPQTRPMIANARPSTPDEGLSDEEFALIERCRHGDTAAFGPLVHRYQDRVYNTCLRLCGKPEDAEDFAQEAFVKAFSSLPRFDGRSRFYTWLFRIAVNVVLSARRGGRRTRTVSLDAAESKGGGRPDLRNQVQSNGRDPSDEADFRERHGRVIAALDELDDEQRAIIILRDIEAMDYAEIAAVLEIAPGTVKSRLHRARMGLRNKLGALVEGECD